MSIAGFCESPAGQRAALAHFESEIEDHGPAEALQPAFRTRLEALYPQDQAVGYAPGEFRGLIRVAIPRGALEDG